MRSPCLAQSTMGKLQWEVLNRIQNLEPSLTFKYSRYFSAGPNERLSIILCFIPQEREEFNILQNDRKHRK